MLWEEVGASGNRASQFGSRNVLNDLTDVGLTTSATNFSQIETARMLQAYWRLCVQRAKPCAGWMAEDGVHGEFQTTTGYHERGY